MSEKMMEMRRETRSRSKTPGILASENGDSEKRGAKKVPTISLIEEEDDVEFVPSSQPEKSQRPKRQRRTKASQETSPDVSAESHKNSQKATETVTTNSKKTVTTVTKSSQVINGSEEKSEQATVTTTTTVVASASNDIGAEVPESQSIFNNIFNAIKTSTPILLNKRSKRTATEVKSSNEVDYNAHPAYKEYKEAGEYWNKYPKTDYTYSELSPHRRELGNGIVGMPNMSRRSLEKYQNRVEVMIQNNPAEESFLRRKFLSNMSFQKRSADLQYDSADEVDVSDLHSKMIHRRRSQQNIFVRLFMLIANAFYTGYSTTKQGVRRVFSFGGSQQRYTYTPVKNHGLGIFQRAVNSTQRFVLLCVSKVYLLISTVLCFDTWLLYSRSANVVENRKRKRFLLGLLILLPLLLLGAFLLSDDTNVTEYFTTSFHTSRFSLDAITEQFSQFSPPQLPTITWNVDWLIAPLVTTGIAFREFIFGAPQAKEQLKKALDEEKFQILLQHIDNYIDNTIGQKLSENNDAIMRRVNDRMLIIISNNIKDALVQYEYHLTTKDIDAIVAKIKAQLSHDLDERDKLILGRISVTQEETAKKIGILTSENLSQAKAIKLDEDNVDIEALVLKILQSDKLFTTIDGHLRPLTDRVDNHDKMILGIQADIDQLKLDVLEKFKSLTVAIGKQQDSQKQFGDDLVKFKSLNDEALKALIIAIEDKFASLSDSHYSSIDASVRKNLLNILGFNSEDQSMDEESIKNWISSTFVAKSYLEERLRESDANSQKVFQLQLDKNAGVLMDEISKEIKDQIALAIQAKSQELKSSDVHVSGGLSEADVLKIVKNVLAIYDADKTGLVDYALESAGAEIVSTRCTENYRIRTAEISFLGIPLWYRSNTPRTVISPSVAVGECWAFEGFPGFLVIKLLSSIFVTGFTVEHIPQSLAPNRNIDSALRNFTVWGLNDEYDKEPVFFGNYTYSAEENAPSLQYFAVQNREVSRPFQLVELRIESNHGNPKYTCLYRFRVHGDQPQT